MSRVLSLFKENISLYSRFYDVKDISIRVHSSHFLETPSDRDVAWANPNDRTVNLIKRATEFSKESINALLRHELAHLCDVFVDKENREQRADDIAFLVCGDRIRYDKTLIQTLDCSGIFPRPDFLPK